MDATALFEEACAGPWGNLNPNELYWRDNYNWFLTQGYRLRPRYHPDWIASWKTNRALHSASAEDSEWLTEGIELNDATRVEDGAHVVLKRVPHVILSWKTQEVAIMQYFSQPELASDPRNHCVPCLEVLQPPNDSYGSVVVMPILRIFDDPDFGTKGEAIDFIRQILVGFAFLHEHRVAHRDVRPDNLLMDGSSFGYERFHFVRPDRNFDCTRYVAPKKTRTESRPRYYIIDFGFSTQYVEKDMPPQEPVRAASDQSVPELKFPYDPPFNPFPIDVYYVGNFIRIEFIDGDPDNELRNGRVGFEFLRPLIEDMTRNNPDDRITMSEAIQKLDDLVAKLGSRTLRSQNKTILPPGYGEREGMSNRLRHALRRAKYTVLRKPAIPQGPG